MREPAEPYSRPRAMCAQSGRGMASMPLAMSAVTVKVVACGSAQKLRKNMRAVRIACERRNAMVKAATQGRVKSCRTLRRAALEELRSKSCSPRIKQRTRSAAGQDGSLAGNKNRNMPSTRSDAAARNSSCWWSAAVATVLRSTMTGSTCSRAQQWFSLMNQESEDARSGDA